MCISLVGVVFGVVSQSPKLPSMLETPLQNIASGRVRAHLHSPDVLHFQHVSGETQPHMQVFISDGTFGLGIGGGFLFDYI